MFPNFLATKQLLSNTFKIALPFVFSINAAVLLIQQETLPMALTGFRWCYLDTGCANRFC